MPWRDGYSILREKADYKIVYKVRSILSFPLSEEHMKDDDDRGGCLCGRNTTVCKDNGPVN